MTKITKTFTETYNLDMEGRHGEWETTAKTYEEALKDLDGWMTAVRVVEKTFDPETFEITTVVVKTTERRYDWDRREWNTVETIG